MLLRHNTTCRSLIIALQALALVFLLASNIWASPDKSKVIVSDHNSVAAFFKTSNESDTDELDNLVCPSIFVFRYLFNFLYDNSSFFLYKHREKTLYLARAPPSLSGF